MLLVIYDLRAYTHILWWNESYHKKPGRCMPGLKIMVFMPATMVMNVNILHIYHTCTTMTQAALILIQQLYLPPQKC